MTDEITQQKNAVALTVAGSDSGGGAGIQADLRAFRAFGVFGCSAITAVTAQNPAEVRGIYPLPPEAAALQIRTVLDVFGVRAAKTGMLFSGQIIRAAAEALSGKTFPLVADPVMVSTSGVRLLRSEAIDAMIEMLLPLADWITPNIPEAELLLGEGIRSFSDMNRAAQRLSERFHCGVIVKGGHAENEKEARDAVCTGSGSFVLVSPRIPVLPHASHGTGCTFSAALAGALAAGKTAEEALLLAKSFVYLSLKHARIVSNSAGKTLIGAMPPVLPGFPEISEDIRLEQL